MSYYPRGNTHQRRPRRSLSARGHNYTGPQNQVPFQQQHQQQQQQQYQQQQQQQYQQQPQQQQHRSRQQAPTPTQVPAPRMSLLERAAAADTLMIDNAQQPRILPEKDQILSFLEGLKIKFCPLPAFIDAISNSSVSESGKRVVSALAFGLSLKHCFAQGKLVEVENRKVKIKDVATEVIFYYRPIEDAFKEMAHKLYQVGDDAYVAWQEQTTLTGVDAYTAQSRTQNFLQVLGVVPPAPTAMGSNPPTTMGFNPPVAYTAVMQNTRGVFNSSGEERDRLLRLVAERRNAERQQAPTNNVQQQPNAPK